MATEGFRWIVKARARFLGPGSARLKEISPIHAVNMLRSPSLTSLVLSSLSSQFLSFHLKTRMPLCWTYQWVVGSTIDYAPTVNPIILYRRRARIGKAHCQNRLPWWHSTRTWRARRRNGLDIGCTRNALVFPQLKKWTFVPAMFHGDIIHQLQLELNHPSCNLKCQRTFTIFLPGLQILII